MDAPGSSGVPLSQVEGWDREKKQQAEAKGITLLAVPFWWDGKLDRYAAPGRSLSCKYSHT